MEIEELILKSYGKFENHRMVFRPGINIIYGGNESGKTTIHSFIRSMFFGLNRSRGRAAKKDEYQLRQPWSTPGAFLGSMRIREGGEVYRIDRCFDRSTEPLSLVCETLAEEFEDPEKKLDSLLGGISEAAFVNTVFVPQAQCETDEALAQELQRFMVNCDSTLDGGLDVTQALQILRKKKKRFEQQKKKEDAELEAEIVKKQDQADALRTELAVLERQAAQYRGAADGRRSAPTGRRDYGLDLEPIGRPGYGRDPEAIGTSGDGPRFDSDWDEGRETETPVWIGVLLQILLLTAGILAAAVAIVSKGTAARVFSGLCAAVFLGLIVVVRLLLRGREAGAEETDGDEDAEAYVPPELLEELRACRSRYRSLQDDLELLYQRHVKPEGADMEIAALTLAIDRICELSESIYRAKGGRLNEIASGILEEITGGRYNRIVIDDQAEVRIHTPSRVLGLHQVSGGTLQQIYFALRMAAGELFAGERKLPVILDETFAMYDDRRLEAALVWLKKSGRQVILFTCQTREREIMKRME